MEAKAKSASTEDFLFTVFQICEGKKDRARLVNVASSLSVSRAAASKMAAKLSTAGMVEKSLYGKVTLTRSGKRLAKQMARMHRVLEVFLHDRLGLRGDELEQQAHKMEHALSSRTLEQLDLFVGRPKNCPHGKRIYRK